MATKNLSQYNPDRIPSVEGMRFAIIVSEWNPEVTLSLRDGAYDTLLKHGVSQDRITVDYVPGSFELPLAAKLYANTKKFDAVICLGAVVRGGTPHFDYVCQGTTQGIMDVNLITEVPTIFGVLTTDDQQQALDRAGGLLGNKGVEAAVAAIKMVALKRALS